MKKTVKYMLVLILVTGAIACKTDNKKPDAVVISNQDADNDAEAADDTAADTTDLTASDPDTAIENYRVADREDEEPENRGRTGDAGANSREALPTSAPAGNNAVTDDNVTRPVDRTDAASAPVKRVVRTKASVQQQLARDARLAKQMPLARFGRYMERRADYYRSFGEVSYEDKTVEIKITREELKIETPEGKYKRESDERKVKTDNGKVKQETRR